MSQWLRLLSSQFKPLKKIWILTFWRQQVHLLFSSPPFLYVEMCTAATWILRQLFQALPMCCNQYKRASTDNFSYIYIWGAYYVTDSITYSTSARTIVVLLMEKKGSKCFCLVAGLAQSVSCRICNLACSIYIVSKNAVE